MQSACVLRLMKQKMTKEERRRGKNRGQRRRPRKKKKEIKMKEEHIYTIKYIVRVRDEAKAASCEPRAEGGRVAVNYSYHLINVMRLQIPVIL